MGQGAHRQGWGKELKPAEAGSQLRRERCCRNMRDGHAIDVGWAERWWVKGAGGVQEQKANEKDWRARAGGK
eukprot:55474-Pleurochrysis_carterae.AAC.2